MRLPSSVLAVAAFAAAALPAQQTADWWAYRPLERPTVPGVRDTQWVQNPIDAFVLSKLEAAGLRPAPAADRHTLLRRATYDLTGLPPTTDEVAAFLADTAPDAFDKVVERLLASPQYGVRWAQHWLDVVRYAETDGYERDRTKPEVWRYRDWVVDAFQQDMSYADFVRRQLAGDELPNATVADHIATGVHRLGIWDDEPTDREQHRYDDLDGMADTSARAFLAVSMGCARCHDHKKDPLSHREYHGFLGFFENIKPYASQATSIPRDGAKEAYERELTGWRTRYTRAVAGLTNAGAGHWATLSPAVQQQAVTDARRALVASFPADRASGRELLDEVSQRHGVVHGQVVQVDGKVGQALRFDGDDEVELPRLVEQSFSVVFWVRSTFRGAGRASETTWFTGSGLVDGEVRGVVPDWGIAWHSDGHVVAGSGAPETFVASAPGYHDGEWHHVAFTRDQSSGRIALYVDGALVGAAEGSKEPLMAPPRLVVGRSQVGGSGFRGDIDELDFYGRALVDAEVAALALQLPGGIAAGEGLAGSPALAEFVACVRPKLPTVDVLSITEAGPKGPEPRLRLRGNVHAPGAAVPLAVPAMVGGPPLPPVAPVANSSGRRTALAAWIVDPRNALSWRVVANRIWQHHFGRGLCRTSNDFGRLGELPTHPELLDWLASEFIARGQSFRAMHRLLLQSATYRMASSPAPAALLRDPQNDLLWRFDRRRLSAEEVRDSLLQMSGELNLECGGPSVFPPLPAEVLATASRPEDAWGEATPAQAGRRSLYVHVKRSLPEPLLAAFDRADTDASCPVRFATVQPTQALTLLNGEFSHQKAAAFAERLQRETSDPSARLARALELTTQRPARPADVQRLAILGEDLQRTHGKDAAVTLQRICLLLLNANEFLFLD